MDQEKEREEKFKILKEIFKTHAHFEHARGRKRKRKREMDATHLVALDENELKSTSATKRKASSRPKDGAQEQSNNKFRFEKEQMGKQYASLYFQRLMVLLPGLKQSVKEQFGTSVPLKRVIQLGAAVKNDEDDEKGEKKESMDFDEDDMLQENKENKAARGEEVVIIGTIYKEMAKKPIILDEYIKTKAGVTKKEQVKHGLMDMEESFVDKEKDFCILEDESARVKLQGPGVNVGELVTGVSAACKGRVNEKGDFIVDSMAFAKPCLAATTTTTTTTKEDDGEPTYVCLVSGLNFGVSALNDVRANMLCEFIEGSLGDEKKAGGISQVLVCGELVSKTREEECIQGDKGAKATTNGEGTTHAKAEKEATSLSIEKADAFLAKVCEIVPVDVMPGSSDPTNSALPQQPIHSCFLPNAARFEGSTLNKVTNPHEFQISSSGASTSSRTFLGTSGQNIRDCLKITSSGVGLKEKALEEKAKSALDVMEKFLKWGHIAPSAPDTLSCYPFKDTDPFVLTQIPDVFFAGCQSAFGTREIVVASQKSVLVSVPSFSETGSVVLLNLKTLKAEEIAFTASRF